MKERKGQKIPTMLLLMTNTNKQRHEKVAHRNSSPFQFSLFSPKVNKD